MHGLMPLAVAVLLVGAARAHASEATDEMVHDLGQLTAPIARTELRFDLGALAGLRHLDGRVDVALEIAPRFDLWYAFGVSTMRTTQVTTTRQASNDGTMPEVTVVERKQTDSFAASLRLFRRVGPIVFGIGMVDNAAGFSTEVRTSQDRFRLELLARTSPSNLGEVPFIRIGCSGRWRDFYAQVGVQDLLDRALVSPYLGLGLRWSDDDLMTTAWHVSH